jgi:hypothetical protein
MGQRRTTWGLVAIAALGATLVVGCGSGTDSNGRPPASSLHEGLNVLEARADWGMNAAYVKSGQVVYLQTRIGPPTPYALRDLDPTTPLHEVDVRYVDELGNSFNIQRGGDSFIDPSWNAEIGQQVPVSSAHRDESFLLAREAGQAALQLVSPDMSEHLEAAVRIGNHVPAEDPDLIAAAAELPHVEANEAGYDSYTHQARVYSKCLATCLVNHSSVYAVEHDDTTNKWGWAMATCNHGTCAGASGVSLECTTSKGGRTDHISSYFTGEGSSSTSTVSGACSTGYNWFTNGSDHNCNDDSWYEDWQVANNKQGSRGTQAGTDSSGIHYACGGGANQGGDALYPWCL